MDTEQIRTLNILDEISHDNTTSQRAMSEKLNISLGLVNSFIKRLGNKGYFKITTIPNNRVKYILTPKGVAEKSRLTYEYIKFSYIFYKSARNRIMLIFNEMVEQNVQKVVFYGAGELAEISHTLIKQTPLELVAVIDPNRRGKKFMGNVIIHPESLGKVAFDKVLITELANGKTKFLIAEELNIPEKSCVLIF
jgi:DNA-binding MarR family transcriptional regulator